MLPIGLHGIISAGFGGEIFTPPDFFYVPAVQGLTLIIQGVTATNAVVWSVIEGTQLTLTNINSLTPTITFNPGYSEERVILRCSIASYPVIYKDLKIFTRIFSELLVGNYYTNNLLPFAETYRVDSNNVVVGLNSVSDEIVLNPTTGIIVWNHPINNMYRIGYKVETLTSTGWTISVSTTGTAAAFTLGFIIRITTLYEGQITEVSSNSVKLEDGLIVGQSIYRGSNYYTNTNVVNSSSTYPGVFFTFTTDINLDDIRQDSGNYYTNTNVVSSSSTYPGVFFTFTTDNMQEDIAYFSNFYTNRINNMSSTSTYPGVFFSISGGV